MTLFRKYLEHSGYEVDFISNFTDVDDKIIKASNEEGISTSELTEKYITAFFKDYDALGCKRATKNPRVTEYMQEIINFIAKLVEEGMHMKQTVMFISERVKKKITEN